MERIFKAAIYKILSSFFLLICILAYSKTLAQNSQNSSGLASVEGVLLPGTSTGSNKISYQQPDIIINFSKLLGKFKPVNGVNAGPFRYGSHQLPLDSFHAEAGFPYTRLHDVNWPHPDAVDINTIFPIFDLDADDPKNYNFEKTDDYLAPIIKNKSEIIYRLGVSIEHFTHYYIYPPKDYNKWAKICINIIRHYNDGWKNGFHYNIKYWEIWNEPEGKDMWLGTLQQYFQLYEVASKAIKAYNPKLRVGGPAATGAKSKLVGPFLAYCRDRLLPLDFFSWHRYTSNPQEIVKDTKTARTILDEYGFKNTESFLDEWHYMPSWAALSPKNNINSTVEGGFAATVGPEGAVFAASVLMLLQESPIDVANFYCADYSPWSMFNVFGVPSKVYYVFKAFNQLAKMSNRVSCQKLSKDSTVVIAAGISEDIHIATFLISNSVADNKLYSIALQNFPGFGKIHVEIYQIDGISNLEPKKEYVLNARDSFLKVELPAVSVCLVKLIKK